jgi:hypothetical protein
MPQEKKTKSKKIFYAACWFWLTLFFWAFSSPPGSSPDEDFHAASIWCANGLNSIHCPDLIPNPTTPFIMSDCFQQHKRQSANCLPGLEQPKFQTLRMQPGLYPKIYYKFLNVFVRQNAQQSLMLMRLINSTLATLIFGVLLVLGKGKQQHAALHAWTFTLVPMGLFLIASINPSSWSYIGVASSWLFLEILIKTDRKLRKTKYLALFMWLLTSLMCLARWDSSAYFIFSNLIVLFVHLTKREFLFKRLLLSTWIYAVIGIGLLWQLGFIDRFFHFNRYGPNRLQSFPTWISYWVVHIIELPVGTFGFPFGNASLGWNDTLVPPIVGIVGICLFISTTIFSMWSISRIQIMSIFAIVAFICLAILSQLAARNYPFSDTSLLQGRYVFPLLPVLIGISILLSANYYQLMDSPHLRFIVIASLSFIHSISLYVNLERYVTGTSDYYRQIDPADGWWWPHFISPNLAWWFGSICFLRFLVSAWSTQPTSKMVMGQSIASA